MPGVRVIVSLNSGFSVFTLIKTVPQTPVLSYLLSGVPGKYLHPENVMVSDLPRRLLLYCGTACTERTEHCTLFACTASAIKKETAVKK